ncbi:MAG TPA: hypothetical protein VF064_15745 [Pyrinomonadaceae bacterium]
MKADDRLGAYVLAYESAARADGLEGLISAELWLNKSDLRAYRMTLVVRRGGEVVEYRLVEGGFERKRAEEVPPGVYRLEPELLGTTQATKDEGGAMKAQRGEGARPSSLIPQPSAVASAELEVEAAYLLNRIKANLGEQVSMGRTTGGALKVEALVESEGRKEAILRALGPVLNNPAVEVEVSTVAEALERRRQKEQGAQTDLAEREVNVRAGRVPADAELRAYFAARLAEGDRVDAEIKRYAASAMNHSRQALLHASALKRLAGRFTPAEARALNPDARAKWLSMIREHAGAYRRETAALRAQLGAVFGAGDEGAGEPRAAGTARSDATRCAASASRSSTSPCAASSRSASARASNCAQRSSTFSTTRTSATRSQTSAAASSARARRRSRAASAPAASTADSARSIRSAARAPYSSRCGSASDTHTGHEEGASVDADAKDGRRRDTEDKR